MGSELIIYCMIQPKSNCRHVNLRSSHMSTSCNPAVTQSQQTIPPSSHRSYLFIKTPVQRFETCTAYV